MNLSVYFLLSAEIKNSFISLLSSHGVVFNKSQGHFPFIYTVTCLNAGIRTLDSCKQSKEANRYTASVHGPAVMLTLATNQSL